MLRMPFQSSVCLPASRSEGLSIGISVGLSTSHLTVSMSAGLLFALPLALAAMSESFHRTLGIGPRGEVAPVGTHNIWVTGVDHPWSKAG